MIYDVFGIGQCCIDFLGTADHFPRANEKCELDEFVIEGGGPVATAVVALSRWGARCTFAGVVGDDYWGCEIRNSLNSEGVDCDGLVTRPGTASQLAFIMAEPACGHRTIFWRRPTGKPLSVDEVDIERIRSSRILHTDGLMIDASLHAARVAQESGVPVVVDAGTLRDGMLDLISASDFFLASERFGRALVSDHDPLGACRKMAEMGPKVTAVTLGERGYAACIEGELLTCPAYTVEAVDTTGCGDIFHAGFIHGLLRHWPYRRCLDFGARAAAQCATLLGGRAGIPDADTHPKTL